MLIHKDDNVAVNLSDGYKYALRPIYKWENIIKYGCPIGHATEDIAQGQQVHHHNMISSLPDSRGCRYKSGPRNFPSTPTLRTFMGYRREDGTAGIRNDVWIVSIDGSVNALAEKLARLTGALALAYPFDDSCWEKDLPVSLKILRGMVRHPNAGGVLILGGSREAVEAFQGRLGRYDAKRVRFLFCGGAEDWMAAGVAIIQQLKDHAATYRLEQVPLFRLVVGLKCDHSDVSCGLTANPLVGRFADRLISLGGSCLLTEVPDMFGAEHLLKDRSASKVVYDKTCSLINNFKDYYLRHGWSISESPASGGLTTPEEMAMDRLQIGGSAPVVDVLECGERVRENGLCLLEGPRDNRVAMANLVASGAQLIIFTTGQGTAIAGPVPVVHVAASPEISAVEADFIDFDASDVEKVDALDRVFFDYVLRVASGQKTEMERLCDREIAFLKDGITL